MPRDYDEGRADREMQRGWDEAKEESLRNPHQPQRAPVADERARQIAELTNISQDCPMCPEEQRAGYTCQGFLIPLTSPGADFNHRAGGKSNVVCTACGKGQELTAEELLRCTRAENAWNEKEQLEAGR